MSSAVVILESGRVVAEGTLAELSRTDPELIVELDQTDGPDPAAALLSALRGYGLEATADGSRRVVVTITSESVFDTVRDALADGGFSVRRLERRTASLEDVYLASAGHPG